MQELVTVEETRGPAQGRDLEIVQVADDDVVRAHRHLDALPADVAHLLQRLRSGPRDSGRGSAAPRRALGAVLPVRVRAASVGQAQRAGDAPRGRVPAQEAVHPAGSASRRRIPLLGQRREGWTPLAAAGHGSGSAGGALGQSRYWYDPLPARQVQRCSSASTPAAPDRRTRRVTRRVPGRPRMSQLRALPPRADVRPRTGLETRETEMAAGSPRPNRIRPRNSHGRSPMSTSRHGTAEGPAGYGARYGAQADTATRRHGAR